MKFCAHLRRINEGYFQHMRHALGFVLELVLAAGCCLIHAFLPFLFEQAGSQRIARLHDRMVVNRARLSERAKAPHYQAGEEFKPSAAATDDSVGSLG